MGFQGQLITPNPTPTATSVLSGVISNNSLGSGAVQSGNIASGQVGNFAIASGQIQGLGGTGVPNIASGTFNGSELAAGAIESGQIASGTPITYSRNIIDDSYLTGEIVSGFAPVCVLSGGSVGVAQGSSGLRMPAFGVAISNQLSGQPVTIVLLGKVLVTSGINLLWSGQINKQLFVSSSGMLMTPTLPSVATLSQVIGICLSGALLVNADYSMTSGGAAIQSGIL